MRIVERYLAAILARNAFFTFLVLAAIVTMMVFSMVALRESMAFVTVPALLEVVGLSSLTQLEVLIPLTILIAAIWSYGKAQADGEINAMREAGVPLFRALQPALLLGAVGAVLLAALGDEVIPWARYEQRRIGKRFLAENVDRLLEDDRNALQDRQFKCRWAGIGTDARGLPFLRDFVVAELGKDDAPPVFTRAGRALPFIDPHQGRLILELHDLTYHVTGAADTMSIALDLRAISEEPAPSRKVGNLGYEELIGLMTDPSDQDQKLAAATELHGRASAAVAALLFSFLGASLGVLLGLRNRATIFAIGFFLVLALYFAPRLLGESLGERGRLSPLPAMWTGNLLILASSLFCWRRSRRR